MLPSILARQLQTGIGDYIEATFPMTNEPFRGSMKKFIDTKDAVYHSPFFTVRMPFRTYDGENNFFEAIHSKYSPYVHQAKAFGRLTGNDGISTIIATGTGSGKTECFLYPILEYCWQHRFDPGIKALIIYPMNALASDQAKRIAELIHNSPELNGNVTAGMYVGGHTKHASAVMSEDSIITDKETMLNNPPDILLTNYKMLDYLLVRPKDAKIWRNNSPETLKYIAVDELHTFDGAQGTDLACLLRRLKNRLGTQSGYLCCVGTSATMGSEDSAKNILNYASEIFGEPFNDEGSIVTEDRLTYSEFLEGTELSEFNIPNREDIAEMTAAIDEDDADRYIKSVTKAWFPDFEDDPLTDAGKLKLAEELPTHTFFQSLIAAINGSFCQSEYITETLRTIYPEFDEITQTEANTLIESMVALISWARTGTEGKLRPFLNVHVQLWLKELTRFLGKVTPSDITYAIESDLNRNQKKHYLPVLNCRDCGATGWVSFLNERNNVSLPDLRGFYNKFFRFEDGIAVLFPYSDDDRIIQYANQAKLCPECLNVMFNSEATECDECGHDELIKVQVPSIRPKRNTKQYICPFCSSKRGLNLIGLRSATEISTSISQMFSSKFNDDKKTLTFSDNVQDAAHRASFFNARTWKFGLRGAIEQYLLNGGDGQNLDDFCEGFIRYWHSKMDDEEFASFFTPPNLTWMRAYENMVKKRKITYDKEFNTLIQRTEKRLAYEIMLEYGLTSHIGRTLEKSGCSVMSFDETAVANAVSTSLERLVNELGMSALTTEQVHKMVIGILDIMRRNGAFDDEIYRNYAKGDFNEFLLRPDYQKGFRIWLPAPRSKLRLVVRNNNNAKIKYKTYDLISDDKYLNYISSCCNEPLISQDAPSIILDELIKNKLVTLIPANNMEVYGLNKEKVYITSKVAFVKCSHCGSRHTIPETDLPVWENAPCISGNCNGTYVKDDEFISDYYSHLYSTGDLARINAKEHTGLLERSDREQLEKDFKRSRDDQKLYDPNVLSCTPTLEMGIDIGDLSSVILCSMPPSQANFAQRVGRAGRKDGNAITIAVANAKPHDLYFYQDPLDMISGEVVPPQIFLKASAVLARQFVAYCMDSWVKSGIDESAIPKRMETCINKLDTRSADIFPFNFMEYVKNNMNSRLNTFISMFAGSFGGDKTVEQELCNFARGNGLEDSPMYLRILKAFETVRDERQSVLNNIELLQTMIKDLEAKPKDSSYDEEIKELRWEESALTGVVRAIDGRNVFNFLSDEGLLPNYAFPESGITLKAVLRRKDENADEKSGDKKYEKIVYEYGRSASSAISEFAPNNNFYVDGKKLLIDQVDIATSKPVQWRLCPNCSHAEQYVAGVHTASCPKCGTPAWADGGQIRSMLKVQMVYSNMDYNKSHIADESEERTNTFFCKQLLVDVDEANDITSAFEMNNNDFPFGYEFVKKATLREINFGERDLVGEKLMVSGIEDIRKGFKICKYCGKLQPVSGEAKHTFTCKARKETFHEDSFEDCLFLYREFTTEILRLLIPATTLDASNVKMESFVAAFMLGMREYFGNVSHLHATISEVPVSSANMDYRKQYLVIYDSVPGGTGYLKQLLQNENALVEIFEKALAVMENCSCKNDPTKDGCYHCLYAYSQSNSIGSISRNTAIRLLKSILSGKNNIKRIKKLDIISTNALFDSELERKFIECLPLLSTEKRTVSVDQTLINGKEGYLLKINDNIWEIEPQVDLDASDGVCVKCRPDFVIRPLFDETRKPVAVFTDGFTFHRDIVADDTLKRIAIIKSGNYVVWSLSYKDIQTLFQNQAVYYTETLDYTKMPSGIMPNGKSMFLTYLKSKGIESIQMFKSGNAELLIQYLSLDNADEVFRHHAEAYMWSLIDANLTKKSLEYAVWKEKMPELIKNLFGTDKQYPLGGIWAARDVNSHFTVYSGTDQKKKNVIAILNDTFTSDKYEAEWNGMWRFFNVMQFLDGFIGVSQKGIDDSAYTQLIISAGTAEDTTADDPAASGEWDEVMEMTAYSDEVVHKLINYAKENSLPIPEIGYEVTGSDDRVLGEIETAWTDRKIGYITEEYQDIAETLKTMGWTLVSSVDEIVTAFGGEL